MTAFHQVRPAIMDHPGMASLVLAAAHQGKCKVLERMLTLNSKLAEAFDEHGNVGSYLVSHCTSFDSLGDLLQSTLEHILVH